MQSSGANVVFFGTEEFSLAALTALIEAGYTVAAVVTKPASLRGRGMALQEPIVKTYANHHSIPVLQPERLIDIKAKLAVIPNRIGVLSSYGKIIPEEILSMFEQGIINIHPSLLPLYRGPSPIETTILNGDALTGVSLMRLVAQMDAGPIYIQETIELTDDTRATDLYKICAQTGSRLLVESLPAIIKGELTPCEQDESRATYTQLLNKKDAYVNVEIATAGEVARHIRAYEIYPRTRTELHGHDVIITRAHVGSETEGLALKCAHDTALVIDELVAPSGRRMSGSDFERGYKRFI